VYVDPAWLPKLTPPAKDETMMLDEAFQVRDESRLSCQIPFTAELDGLRVTLAPEY
jgi:2Fe-2S ferredoxin